MAAASPHPDTEAALRWADHVRSTRAAVCADLSSGRTDLAAVFARRDDPAVGCIHLRTVLESVPGARKVDTRRALAAAGLAETLPLAEVPPEALDAWSAGRGPELGGAT